MASTAVHIIQFDAQEVGVLLAHAQQSKTHEPTYEQLFEGKYRLDGKDVTFKDHPKAADMDQSKLPWGLTLVADHGVYLMSNGSPRDLVDSRRGAGKERMRVCYAKGLNPDVAGFDDWYERKRKVCGGDDQVVALNGAVLAKVIARGAGALRLRIRTNGESITSISLAPPIKRKSQTMSNGVVELSEDGCVEH